MKRSPSSRGSSRKRVAIAIDLEEVVPWHHDCCEGILHYGRAHGWSCSITPFLLGPAGEEAVGLYDGVVGRIGSDVAEAALAQGVPVVNHWMNSPVEGLPSVGIDYLQGAEAAGAHLLACGYRSLGYLGGQDDVMVGQQTEGLERAAAGAGLARPEVRLFELGEDLTRSREVFSRFLGELDRWVRGLKTPIGLFVGKSTLSLYLVQGCLARGLSVPGDVGIVVSHDDMRTVALSPSLTVVETRWLEVGRQAAAMLDELMAGQALHPRHRLVSADRLIERDSTDVFICEDALVKDAMRYIAQHCREELTIDAVAEALGVSARTLQRRFKEALGRSVRDEINRQRIARLKLMVQETGLSFIEIAKLFGLSSSGQFSRYFSKAVGMTPSAYRKRYGTQEADQR